jgi:hypothetical protein
MTGAKGVTSGEEHGNIVPKAPAQGMEALMQRAQAMRASAYPESTANGSDASRWTER